MKLTSPLLIFKRQDKDSQTGSLTQLYTREQTTVEKFLTASLCLRIIQAHYGLSVSEVTRLSTDRLKEVHKALKRLTGGYNSQEVANNACRIIDELRGQSEEG